MQIEGLGRTRATTIRELLPRAPPAAYGADEVAEFKRRVQALAIFDNVAVEATGGTLHVRVREKWTLIPNLSLTTGRTPKDLMLECGLEEYNFLGRAARVTLNLVREERGFGFLASATEHPYRFSRWSWGAEASYRAAAYRFAHEPFTWVTWIGRGTIWFESPSLLSPYLRYSVAAVVQHEELRQPPPFGAPQHDDLAVQSSIGVTYDRYQWHDLVPRGLVTSVRAGVGASVYTPKPRHMVYARVKYALPLWPLAIAAVRLDGSTATRGNPHASQLLGSIDGVRGLPDGLYRTWIHALLNVELRQSVYLIWRFALQIAAFADSACFEPMTARGSRGDALCALAAGWGARVVPMFLANAMLRVDASRLLFPERNWFVQLAFGQHF